MTLKITLKNDLTEAMKAKDVTRVSTIRSVIGAVQSAEKAGKTAVEFDNEQVLDVIRKQLKQRRESAEIYTAASILDRANQENAEAKILEAYLPLDLTPDEVEAMVTDAVASIEQPTMKDFGAIMKIAVAQANGQADGKIISELVRAKLAVNLLKGNSD